MICQKPKPQAKFKVEFVPKLVMHANRDVFLLIGYVFHVLQTGWSKCQITEHLDTWGHYIFKGGDGGWIIHGHFK